MTRGCVRNPMTALQSEMKEKQQTDSLSEEIFNTFGVVIEKAEIKDLPGILGCLSQVDSETEQAIYVEKLSKKLGIDKRAIIRDIKNNSRKPEIEKKTLLTSLTPPIPIIEVIRTDEGLRYCLSDYEVTSEIECKGTVYQVPINSELVFLPSDNFFKIGLEDSDELLFNDVEAFIYEHSDIGRPFAYKVLTLWVLHTWLLDKFNTSPILHFLGPYASGKSRAGDTVGILAKRGLCTVNMTGAPIFRVSELYQPTFIIDEVKLSGKDRDRDILELLNARFQRGRKVIRINTDRTGLDSIQEFNVFGATVLCGLDELPETPRSRAIIFNMEQNIRPVSQRLDRRKADALRDRLCSFRARYLSERMPEVSRFLKDGRLFDAVEPLHKILKLVKPDIENSFFSFFKEIEKERKEDTYDSFDAEIVKALIECRDKVEQGKILVSFIKERFNHGRPENEHLNVRTIGRALSRLGLKKTRTTGGIHARLWDNRRIERLSKKYGLSDDSDLNDEKILKKGEVNIISDEVIEVIGVSE